MGGQRSLISSVPRLLEAGQLDDLGKKSGGKPPHQQTINVKRRTNEPAGVRDRESSRRVGQLGQRRPQHSGDLEMVYDADGARLRPPAQHWGDHEVAGRQVQGRQLRDDLNARRIEAHLFTGLPQCRGDRPSVNGIDRATRKRDLARMRAHAVGPLSQHHILAALRTGPEQDQHR